MTASVSARLACIKTNENKLNTNSSSGINDGRINDKIANLLSSTKKMSSKTDFFPLKTS